MKTLKCLLPLLFVFLCIFIPGCSGTDKTKIEEVITEELDLLKNLDSDTTMKYISYKKLFPDATESTEPSADVKEVFSLFFRNFDYKILDINVDQKKKTATASIQMDTLDARSLAKDFTAARLKKSILEAAGHTANTNDKENSLEERYLLMGDLLNTREYDTTRHDCTINLKCTDQKDDVWEIQRTYSLENDLVGGLISYLSDPDILPAEDTLAVYLNTLKNMNIDEMSSYLGVQSLLNSSDSSKNAIAAALVEQVHDHFNYEITDLTEEGYTATIMAIITTFDSASILTEYQEKLDAYLSTPEAVIDGSQKRYEESLSLLLECINNNSKTVDSEATFRLINDGVSWKLEENDTSLGNAIFGTLSTTPVDENSAYEDDEYAYEDSYSYETD